MKIRVVSILLLMLLPGAVLAQTETPEPSAADLIQQALTATAVANPLLATRVVLQADAPATEAELERYLRVLNRRLAAAGVEDALLSTKTSADALVIELALPVVANLDGLLVDLTTNPLLEIVDASEFMVFEAMVGQPLPTTGTEPDSPLALPTVLTGADMRFLRVERDPLTLEQGMTFSLDENDFTSAMQMIRLLFNIEPSPVVLDGVIIGFFDPSDVYLDRYRFSVLSNNVDPEMLIVQIGVNRLPAPLTVESIANIR